MRSAVGGVTLAALAVFGGMRLRRTPTAFVDGVQLRIMQPNLPQDEKFNYAAKQQVMERYRPVGPRDRPASSGLRDVTHLSGRNRRFRSFSRASRTRLPHSGPAAPGTVLITGAGAPRRAGAAQLARLQFGLRDRPQWHDPRIYDKVHLVPFGEYLPFQASSSASG